MYSLANETSSETFRETEMGAAYDAPMEIGLPPMQAIQSIAIINNRPTIYGDGALALVRASGLLEEMNERTDGQGDAMVAICTVKRRGEPQATVRQFSVVDAKKDRKSVV